MEYKGTIKAKEKFDAEWSAERFKKALRGFGSDERALIQLVISHDLEQRFQVMEKYKDTFGTDLIDDLKAEFGGTFEEALVSLLMDPEDLLVTQLRDTLVTGLSVDEKTLIEILCNQTPGKIHNINEIYLRKFEESLEDCLHANMSGDLLHLMTSLVSEDRAGGQRPDPILARKEAQDLYEVGIAYNGGWDSDESEFARLLTTTSYPQLQETLKEYDRIAVEPIEKTISSSGVTTDLKQGLLAIIQRVKDPLGFFAERLNESMRGAGTDDNTLIRIIVSRSELDLEDIKKRYKEMYGTTLSSDVRADTSGDYGKLLVAIVGT